MNIKIYYEEVNYKLRGWRKIRELIKKVISEEDKISGDLNFILTNDEIIKKINKKFLKRSYYTDVISFDYSNGKIVAGDVYISLETVKWNAKNYKVSYKEEILRVIIHGILHLCGYNDKTKKEKRIMREKENLWIRRIWER